MRRKVEPVEVAGARIGEAGSPLLLIAGPCVIESEDLCLEVARACAEAAAACGFAYVFKASFDKANRQSVDSFRGPGLAEGLRVLRRVKSEVGCPVLTDVHEPAQATAAAEVVDVLQIPAFLCRQTDLLVAAGDTGLTVNIKKGQFVAPWDMCSAVEKVRSTGNRSVLLTERGSAFGYGRWVVDMRALPQMRCCGVPVIFDATHAVQLPGAGGGSSGGEPEYIPTLSRAAVAAGADGVFIETHPRPQDAKSDGANMLPLAELPGLLGELSAVRAALLDAGVLS